MQDFEFEEIFSVCSSLYNIDNVYLEVARRHPELSPLELREGFILVISEFMRRGWLRFVGEFHLFDLSDKGVNPMFCEDAYLDWDFDKNGARPADDPSPEGVAALIRSKWPSEMVPAFDFGHPGFDPLWFYKWEFQWRDEQGFLAG